MPTLNAFVSTAEAMQSVKAALAKASAGPKKDAALPKRLRRRIRRGIA